MIASVASAVFPVARSPRMSSRCPRPIGSMASSAVSPVWRLSATGRRSTTIGASPFASIGGPPSSGRPSGSTILPSKLSPIGTWTTAPVPSALVPDARSFPGSRRMQPISSRSRSTASARVPSSKTTISSRRALGSPATQTTPSPTRVMRPPSSMRGSSSASATRAFASSIQASRRSPSVATGDLVPELLERAMPGEGDGARREANLGARDERGIDRERDVLGGHSQARAETLRDPDALGRLHLGRRRDRYLALASLAAERTEPIRGERLDPGDRPLEEEPRDGAPVELLEEPLREAHREARRGLLDLRRGLVALLGHALAAALDDRIGLASRGLVELLGLDRRPGVRHLERPVALLRGDRRHGARRGRLGARALPLGGRGGELRLDLRLPARDDVEDPPVEDAPEDPDQDDEVDRLEDDVGPVDSHACANGLAKMST